MCIVKQSQSRYALYYRAKRTRVHSDPVLSASYKAKASAYTSQYQAKRNAVDPKFRMIKQQKNLIRTSLKQRVYSCKKSEALIIKVLGCDRTTFRNHIQKHFKKGMTWDTYGRNGWKIEAVLPIGRLNELSQKDLKVLLGYWNCKPCWVKETK